MRGTTLTPNSGGALGHLDQWATALDALELDLQQTNALLDETFADEQARVALERAKRWRVPQGLGPLPPELAERASEVLTEQKATASRLARAMTESRRHSKMLDASDTRPADRPVYLDTEG